MTPAQVAANARATAWLADRLEAAGYDSNATAEAEHVVRELLAHGLAPIPKPVPLHGPSSTEAGRLAAKQLFETTRNARHEETK